MRTKSALCLLLLMPCTSLLAQDAPEFSRRLLPTDRAVRPGQTQPFFGLEEQLELHPAAAPASKGKVFLRSLVIPGWGQKTIGSKTSARTFLAVELALWAGFTALQLRGHWLQDDYRLFGQTHAGFDEAGKADRYFVDIGNFNSIDEYNEAKLRNRDVAGLYDRDAYYWQWDSEANRLRYDDIRVRSESAFSNSSFVIAGVLANHVISGIHAAYIAGRREKQRPQGEIPSPKFFVASSARDIRVVAWFSF